MVIEKKTLGHCLEHWNKENERKDKNMKFIS